MLNNLTALVTSYLDNYCVGSNACALALSASFSASANDADPFFYRIGSAHLTLNGTSNTTLLAPNLNDFDLCEYTTPESFVYTDISCVGVSLKEQTIQTNKTDIMPTKSGVNPILDSIGLLFSGYGPNTDLGLELQLSTHSGRFRTTKACCFDHGYY